MSNYHGCKGEVINLIPHYVFDLIDIIYKTVKASHLEKLQIIPNINKLKFQVPREFKERWEDVSLRLILKGKGGKKHCLLIFGSKQWV